MSKIIRILVLSAFSFAPSIAAGAEPVGGSVVGAVGHAELLMDIKKMLLSWSVLDQEVDVVGAEIHHGDVLQRMNDSADPLVIGESILQHTTGKIIVPDDRYCMDFLSVISKIIVAVESQKHGILSHPLEEQERLMRELSSERGAAADKFHKDPIDPELKLLQDEAAMYYRVVTVQNGLEDLLSMYFVNRMATESQEMVDEWILKIGIQGNARVIGNIQKNGINVNRVSQSSQSEAVGLDGK